MKRFLNIEFNRVVKSYGFLASVALGVFLGLGQYYFEVLKMRQYLDVYLREELSMLVPHSVFYKWIGGEGYTFQHYMLMICLPIIASMPWASSTYADRKETITNNMWTRGKKRDYLLSKYIVNFLIGGTCCLLPFVINIVLTAATLPSLVPEVATGGYSIKTGSMFAELFYTRPYTYVFLYMIVIFAFCGLFATTALSSGEWGNNSFTIILFPLILHLFMYEVCSPIKWQRIAPYHFLDPSQSAPDTKLWIIMIEAFVMIVFSTLSFYKGLKREL